MVELGGDCLKAMVQLTQVEIVPIYYQLHFVRERLLIYTFLV